MKHRRIRPIVAALISVAILASCSAEEEAPEPERAVHSVNSSLPEVEVEQLSLPFAFQELPAFTLPFEDIPRSADGILFGLHEVDGVLEFSAVSTDGEVLWTTERPASCSGFTLSKIGETPIAVLTDVESTDDALAQVTASAYDLRTGELQWGPVPVAGAWQGPGTVFAEAAPASAMGETGQRQVLDPASGEPVEIDGHVIGEFDGTILSASDAGGEAAITAEGEQEWEVPLAQLLPEDEGAATDSGVKPLPGQARPPGFALLGIDDSPEAALIDLSNGDVVSPRATSAAWDPAAEMLIFTEPGTLAGYTPEGPAWNRELAEGLRITASGGVLTYLRSDTAVQVINAVTGEDAVGYDPEATNYAIPSLVTADGAAVFNLEDLTLIGTHEGP